MSTRILRCPYCHERPKLMRRWHDKYNRVFNHLKWQAQCEAGCISLMGSDRQEAIYLFNSWAKAVIVKEEPAPVVEQVPMTWRKLLSLIWNGWGSSNSSKVKE